MADDNQPDVADLERKHRLAIDHFNFVQSQTKDPKTIAKARQQLQDAATAYATAAQRKKQAQPNTGAAGSLFGLNP